MGFIVLLMICCLFASIQAVQLFKNTDESKENMWCLASIISIQIMIVVCYVLFELSNSTTLIVISGVVLFVILYFVVIACIKMMMNKQKDFNENMQGKDGIVIEEINNIVGNGVVKIGSDVWSAKSYNGDIISNDSIVKVEKIEGVKVVVSKKN